MLCWLNCHTSHEPFQTGSKNYLLKVKRSEDKKKAREKQKKRQLEQQRKQQQNRNKGRRR